MEQITQILRVNPLRGAASGTNHETEEERLERERKDCEFLCECENKRQGNLNESDGYNCDKCHNKGYIFEPYLYIRYTQKMVDCKCMKIRKAINALNRSGLQNVVHDCTFDKYIATEDWQKGVLNTAQKYLSEKENPWFFFGGQSGSGKTHICTAVAVTLLKRGNEVKYMLWCDEIKRLKAMVNAPEYEYEIKKYKDVDVLYIDDLFKTGRNETQGRQRPTAADINIAFEIINSRAFQKKITIISSESLLTEIIDFDGALGGRIRQMCKGGDYCTNIAPDPHKNYRLR